MKRTRGFTLIELMIVVMIIAILAALALSGYQKQVRKSRRAEAKQVMGDYATREEKYRSNHVGYTTDLKLLLDVATAPTTWGSGFYTIAITVPAAGNCPSGAAKGAANSFIITATAIGDQAADTACTPLVYTNDCGTVTKTPGGGTGCW